MVDHRFRAISKDQLSKRICFKGTSDHNSLVKPLKKVFTFHARVDTPFYFSVLFHMPCNQLLELCTRSERRKKASNSFAHKGDIKGERGRKRRSFVQTPMKLSRKSRRGHEWCSRSNVFPFLSARLSYCTDHESSIPRSPATSKSIFEC
jgi:hypothetical protein